MAEEFVTTVQNLVSRFLYVGGTSQSESVICAKIWSYNWRSAPKTPKKTYPGYKNPKERKNNIITEEISIGKTKSFIAIL